MARVYPLFSSSKGNATFIGNSNSGILVDVGVSFKRLNEGLEICGLSADAVKAIFITHEHGDHISGLSVFTKHFNIPVYAKPLTLEYIINNNKIAKNAQIYSCEGDICVQDMKITSFDTMHDTEQSCGYTIFTGDEKKISVCTDLGKITDVVERNILGSDFVLLESNYDENMLGNGCYPQYLKQRIASQLGHLSNSQSAFMVKKLIENGTTRVYIGHLSQENNTPSIAEGTALKALAQFKRNKDYILEVAPVCTSGQKMIF